jgi:hypothetical protein
MSSLPKGFNPQATSQMIVVGSDGIVKKVWVGALGSGGRNKEEVEQVFHVKLPGFELTSTL